MFHLFSKSDVYRDVLLCLLTHFSPYVVHTKISKTFSICERREYYFWPFPTCNSVYRCSEVLFEMVSIELEHGCFHRKWVSSFRHYETWPIYTYTCKIIKRSLVH